MTHDERVALAKREIAEDVRAGRVPPGVRSFSALHDYVDANEYGGLCGVMPTTADGEVDVEAMNAVQLEVDAWLRAGAGP